MLDKKSSGRAGAPAQNLTFSFFADGLMEVSTERVGLKIADLAADVLAEGPLTLADIAKAIREDTGEVVSADSLRKAMSRPPRRFVEAQTGRPRRWSMKA